MELIQRTNADGSDVAEVTDQILVPVLPSYWILVQRHSEASLQALLCYFLELQSKISFCVISN